MFELDNLLFLSINATTTSPAWLVPLARFASQELPQWLVAGTIGAFVVGDTRIQRCVLRVVCAMLVAWLLARLGQHFFPMPRPFSVGMGTVWLSHAQSAGFPSTHASVAFAFGATLAWSTQRRLLTLAALGLATLIAWSRICLGLHFPSDALAGAGIGVASAWLAGLVPLATRKVHPAL